MAYETQCQPIQRQRPSASTGTHATAHRETDMATTTPNALFMTGTDTGVGKTHVSVSLVKALVKHGLRVAVMKPIASGCEPTPHGLRNEDAVALMEASNVGAPYATVNPYCFGPAISPHIAAEEAKISVDLRLIRDRFEALTSNADFTVVEGAGGWYAPISTTHSMADVPKSLQIPAVLVVGVRLGCLNHARLSREAIEARGVPLAGWVANCIDPTLQRAAENLATLERILGSAALAVFPSVTPVAHADVRCGEQLARRLSLISF
jgi:dethiobiotin synthetase